MKALQWYVGRSQQDEGESETFDGTVWETPSLEEQQYEAASQGEYIAEPYLVAERIRHEPYANLIAAAPALLAACKAALQYIQGDADGSCADRRFAGRVAGQLIDAIARAAGESS